MQKRRGEEIFSPCLRVIQSLRHYNYLGVTAAKRLFCPLWMKNALLILGLVDSLDKVIDVLDRFPVDLLNDVARPDPCIVCRATGLDAINDDPFVFFHTEFLGDLGREILDYEPEMTLGRGSF